jgi:hypothetical protein
VEQLEDGVVELWRNLWNAQAFTDRKRYYRDLLRQRREARNESDHEVADDDDEAYALPTAH